MKTTYWICVAYSPKELEGKVNHMLSQGWTLSGGVCLSFEKREYIVEMRATWAQAVIYTEDNGHE